MSKGDMRMGRPALRDPSIARASALFFESRVH
jgi:hypothetical protein